MASGEDTVEHTLYIGREVSLYQIPPRPGAEGHKSGDWKTADKIFSGRLRCVASGESCEVRVEDPNTYVPSSQNSRRPYLLLMHLCKSTGHEVPGHVQG